MDKAVERLCHIRRKCAVSEPSRKICTVSGSARHEFEKNLLLAVEVTTDRVEADVAAGLIADQLPRFVDRRKAHALVEAAYDAHHAATPELDRSTTPFARVELAHDVDEGRDDDRLPEERDDLGDSEPGCDECDFGCDLCVPPHMMS